MALLFHSDDDLTKVRPDILNYGVTDFEDQMTESEDIVLRKLESDWYRNIAANYGLNYQTTPFNSALLLTTSQLTRVCTYKSLQLIYLFLQKEAKDPDAFERQSNTFKKMYQDELKEVLTSGVDYDWNEDDTIDAGENLQPAVRRLVRV